MRIAPILGLLALGGCSSGPPPYLLECKGSQDFEWTQMHARSLTTVYYRIDEARDAIFAQASGGQFDNVCRTSCAQMAFGRDAITWTDTSEDGDGGGTRIENHLARASGELTIRTESVKMTEFGLETTLHGEGHFHCHEVDRLPAIATVAL